MKMVVGRMGHRPNVCRICGGSNDRNGDHCKACRKAIRRGINIAYVKALGRLDVPVALKRKCLGCSGIKSCLRMATWRPA
jgi:hypothetical protein